MSLELNRFEQARVIGARALQLASGAPPLIELSKDSMNPVKISFEEFEKGMIPISVVE